MSSVPSDHQPVKELYKFSPEEVKVLQQCNYESFYYRSVPIGTALGTMAYFAVKSGYLKGSVKYGPWPKTLLGITVGYFAGKLSYQSKCAEKIMSLPDSRLGEALRKRKGRGTPGALFQEGFSSEPVNVVVPLTDVESQNHQDLIQEMRSEDRSYEAPPSAAGLNDSFRPTMDSFSVSDQPLPPPSPVTNSYDDLRRKNREEYDQKRAAAYTRPPAAAAPPPQRPVDPIGGGGKKNAYGDVWEE